MKKEKTFSNISESLHKELFEQLVSSKKCKIERIISKNHSTPEEKWYDQEKK